MKRSSISIITAVFALATVNLACQALSANGGEPAAAPPSTTTAAQAAAPDSSRMPVLEDSDTTINIIADGDYATLYDLKNEAAQDEAYEPAVERYTVDLTSETNVDLASGWCTTTESKRTSNKGHFDPAITVNGHLIPDSQLEYFEWKTDDGRHCFSWDIVASNWPVGEHQVSEAYTFDAAVNDGSHDYAAGEYAIEYAVTVTEGASLASAAGSDGGDSCMMWDELTLSMKGETVCFRGIITKYDISTGMARYFFSDKSGGPFIYSVKYEVIDPNTGKTIAPGTCVEISAPLGVEGDRPAINVDPILDDDSGDSGYFTFYEDKSACE